MQTAFCSYACKTLLQAFCSHNSASLFIQQRHRALPLQSSKDVRYQLRDRPETAAHLNAVTTCEGLWAGLVAAWPQWCAHTTYGVQHQNPSACSLPMGWDAKGEDASGVARGNAKVSVQYLGTVSLFSRWLVWKLAYTFFFFFFDFLEHVRTKINEDSHKRYQTLRYHVWNAG